VLPHCEFPTNNQRHIVGWDPRGVGNTHPYIGCFNSTEEEAAFWQGAIPHNGIEAKGNFTNFDETDPDVQAFWQQEPEVDKLLGELGQICLRKNGDTLLYVGTAAVSILSLFFRSPWQAAPRPHHFGATFAPRRRACD